MSQAPGPGTAPPPGPPAHAGRSPVFLPQGRPRSGSYQHLRYLSRQHHRRQTAQFAHLEGTTPPGHPSNRRTPDGPFGYTRDRRGMAAATAAQPTPSIPMASASRAHRNSKTAAAPPLLLLRKGGQQAVRPGPPAGQRPVPRHGPGEHGDQSQYPQILLLPARLAPQGVLQEEIGTHSPAPRRPPRGSPSGSPASGPGPGGRPAHHRCRRSRPYGYHLCRPAAGGTAPAARSCGVSVSRSASADQASRSRPRTAPTRGNAHKTQARQSSDHPDPGHGKTGVHGEGHRDRPQIPQQHSSFQITGSPQTTSITRPHRPAASRCRRASPSR